MWIHYPDRIQESVDTLLAQERRLRRSAIADRVKMLVCSKVVAIAARANWPPFWAIVIGPYVGGGSSISSRAWPGC